MNCVFVISFVSCAHHCTAHEQLLLFYVSTRLISVHYYSISHVQ